MNAVFEQIYRNNYQKLYTLAFRMTGNTEDSEDILQISFLNAYKAYPSFRNESSVYTWLYRIVMNTAKKFYKEERKLPVDEYAENNNLSLNDVYNYINSFGAVEDEVLINFTRESCLQMFMNCMPPRYRSVYTLREMLKFSVKETSEILEISESSVKTNLHRAKKAARDHIEGRCSLIKKGAICDCRLYAGYLKQTGKSTKLKNIEIIKNNEKKAVIQFQSEIKLINKIDNLYNTNIKPPDYNDFLKKIKILIDDEKFTLLNTN